MKKLFLLILCVVRCALCIDLRAQDDAESIVSGDIEVEGLENFWVESRLVANVDAIEGFIKPRPFGGNIAFLIHVQKYMSKIFNVLFEKYPEEMLGLIGTRTEMRIEFVVTKDNVIKLQSITNGALFGFDVVVVEKMFQSYKKWRAAKINGKAVDSQMELIIDVSI